MGTVRRLAFLAVGSLVWLGLAAVPASADNGPHYPSAGNTAVDRCAGCHRAHTAPAPYLLRAAQPALCYTCHGAAAGGASTDVYDGVGYPGYERGGTAAGGQALRGGGFGYALIGSGSATRTPPGVSPAVKTVPVLTTGEATTSTHSVDGSTLTAWGNGAISSTVSAGTAIALRCGSCHDPHGNGNYRILRAIPTDSGAATGVAIPDSAAKVYTTGNYWATDDPNSPPVTTPITVTSSTGVVTTYTPSVFIANISAWCTTCHTRYLAPSGSYENSSGDALYTYRHRSDQNYREGGANCITCHIAHGTNAAMSGTYSGKATNPDGSGPAGSSKLLRVDNRGTCNMCHRV
ncbi:MAG: cytochrome c3 family protein [Actinobacteria bacterium]|nr:cytochrome c3 family protein [Actinomycetota bacterium]MBI3686872.1 cytochrome c3 family protein [Actinomycetota bacterium]